MKSITLVSSTPTNSRINQLYAFKSNIKHKTLNFKGNAEQLSPLTSIINYAVTAVSHN